MHPSVSAENERLVFPLNGQTVNLLSNVKSQVTRVFFEHIHVEWERQLLGWPNETLPEAQRTQKLTLWLELNSVTTLVTLEMLTKSCQKSSSHPLLTFWTNIVTFIHNNASNKFGHQMAPLALVESLAVPHRQGPHRSIRISIWILSSVWWLELYLFWPSK